MLTKRQEKLLKIIVEEYVKSARPVGSNLICKILKCSSATVRNEMSYLESIGLLEKTHISSGRVPSEKGYRYYVDNLMEVKKMNGEDVLKLQIIFKNQQLALNDSIKKSLEIISDITSYTTIVLGKASHDNKLKEISVVPTSRDEIVVIAVTDKSNVEHKTVKIDNIDMEDIKKTVKLINDLIIGTPIDEINTKLEFEIKPIIGRYVKEHEIVYNTFYQVFEDFSKNNKNMDISGKNNILKQPEFDNIDKVKNIFNKFDSGDLIDAIEENDNDIKIYIGHESNIDDDMTIIKTSYKTDREDGTIAIIGPKRMDYERVVSLLEYIKQNIER